MALLNEANRARLQELRLKYPKQFPLPDQRVEVACCLDCRALITFTRDEYTGGVVVQHHGHDYTIAMVVHDTQSRHANDPYLFNHTLSLIIHRCLYEQVDLYCGYCGGAKSFRRATQPMTYVCERDSKRLGILFAP